MRHVYEYDDSGVRLICA